MPIASSGSASRILYVDGAAGPGGNGSSWASAYANLQSALAAAQPGDQVWVAQGTYTPAGPGRDTSFILPDGVDVLGGFAGNEESADQRNWVTNPTILSGHLGASDDPNNNVYHVVTATDLTDPTVLDGFTITAGYADGPASTHQDRGAGLFTTNSPALSLSHLSIAGNQAEIGGGLYNAKSSLTLEDDSFSDNVATLVGGGMFNDTSAPSLTNIAFGGNSASYGGGMFSNALSAPTLLNVTFSNNVASRDGGGYSEFFDRSILNNVRFIHNSAYIGGGMSVDAGSPVLNGVVFARNVAWQGGAIHNSAGSPKMVSVAFHDNDAIHFGNRVFNDRGAGNSART
jgi:hypothetical protein